MNLIRLGDETLSKTALVRRYLAVNPKMNLAECQKRFKEEAGQEVSKSVFDKVKYNLRPGGKKSLRGGQAVAVNKARDAAVIQAIPGVLEAHEAIQARAAAVAAAVPHANSEDRDNNEASSPPHFKLGNGLRHISIALNELGLEKLKALVSNL